MILIPIGQEDNVVRRTPWVSFGLIAANFAIFLLLSFSGPSEEQIHDRLQAFFKQLSQHPYLNPPPEIANRLGAGFTKALEEVRGEWAAHGGTEDPASTPAEQERLDDLGREAMEILRSRPVERLGYVPAEPRAATLVTSLFVHGGWLHILGNMLFLFLSGPFIEDKYGRPLFAGLYLVSGIAGNLAHAAHEAGSYIPLVGASGAIAGVMGAFLVRLGTARIRFLFIPIIVAPMLRFKPLLPAFVVIPLWIGEQVWYAGTAPDLGVAFWAHIGGFAFGFAAAFVLKLLRVEESVIHPAIEKEIGLTQNPSLEAALDARLKGDFLTARREVRRALAADPDNVDAWTESYETALQARDAAEVGRAGERLLALHSRHGETGLASEIAHDARWREMEELPARFRLALAAWFERNGDGRSALEQYQAVASLAPQDPAALRALVRSAEILRASGDLKRAREAYSRARAHPACNGPWPALIEKGLAALE
jgi:membrane associated rhomboid family serine protease